MELAEHIQATVILYSLALEQANVQKIFSVQDEQQGILILPTVFAHVVMYTFVSETDRDTEVSFKHSETKTPIQVTVPAQRTAIVFVNRKDGKIISQL